MMTVVRVAAAQTPEFRDDIETALRWIIAVADEAKSQDVDLLCFPEAFLQGYLTDPQEAHRVALELRSADFEAILGRLPRSGPTIVLGMIERDQLQVFNTAVVLAGGEIIGRYRKANLLPGEGVFTPGNEAPTFEVGKLRFGINICSDTNASEAAAKLAASGAMLIVCPANNMMPRQKAELFKDQHNAVRAERCRETELWLISSDVTGTRDDRIAWGPTAILNPRGEVVAQLALDAPGLLVFDLPLSLSNAYGPSIGSGDAQSPAMRLQS